MNIERYNRFIDDNGRLFIVLGINSHKVEEKWQNKSIDLLNVNAEKVNEVNLPDFENYINKKLLTKVSHNKPKP